MLRHSTLAAEGGPLKVSKWLSTAILLDLDEMKSFLEEIGNFHMLRIDTVVQEPFFSKEDFLDEWASYLKTWIMKTQSAWTISENVAYVIDVEGNRKIVKLSQPAVMAAPNRVGYSEGQFRTGVLGRDALILGLQLSYPQLFQDPKTCCLAKVLLDDTFVNTSFFRKIQLYVRHHTSFLKMEKEGKKMIVPVRVGKKRIIHSWLKENGFH